MAISAGISLTLHVIAFGHVIGVRVTCSASPVGDERVITDVSRYWLTAIAVEGPGLVVAGVRTLFQGLSR